MSQYTRHTPFLCVTPLIRMWHDSRDTHMTTLMLTPWHDSLTCATWLMHTCVTRLVVHAYTATWLIDMCDMTHAHICTTTHWPEWHDSCIHVWHDSLTCAPWLIHTPERRKFPPPPHCPFYWRYYACRWPSSTCACLKEYQMTQSTYWEDSFAVLRV